MAGNKIKLMRRAIMETKEREGPPKSKDRKTEPGNIRKIAVIFCHPMARTKEGTL